MKRKMSMSYSGLSTKQIIAVSFISFATIALIYRIDKVKDFVTDTGGFFSRF